MIQLHTCLGSEVAAFNFGPDDFIPLIRRFPQLDLVHHSQAEDFLAHEPPVRYLLTWAFRQSWYVRCPALRAIFTPAAGRDWIEPDPRARVQVVHGTFHGRILAESLLGAMLYLNRRLPAMQRNFRARGWDRNLQRDSRLLSSQTVFIIGLGHIGSVCARLLADMGARVIGFKRNPGQLTQPLPGIEVRPVSELDAGLGEADHVVLLLPGDEGSNRLLSLPRILRCKEGVFLYNFGRGNALASEDLLAARGHIGGAFLDVADEEPLPASSALWEMDKLMLTPHSSCVCQEYKAAFIEELGQHLAAVL